MKKILPILLVLLFTTGAGCSLPGMSKKESDYSRFGGVYKSVDAGTNWTQKTAFPTSEGVGNIGTATVLSMVMDPQDHNTVYVGTSENGLLVSYNGGDTWQASNDSKLQSGAVVAVAVDYKDMCNLYAAVGQKIYVSDNCGRSFSESYNETRNNVKIKQLVADWYNKGTLYAGLTNGDVVKTTDFGKTWSRVKSFGKSVNSIMISQQDSRVMLAGTDESLWKTTDAGLNWTEITDVLKNYSQAKVIYNFTQSANGSTIIMSSKFGLLRSTDLGETWSEITLITPAKQVVITALAIDPKDTNIIYYTTDSTFYKSVNGGVNWTTQELTAGWDVSQLIVDPVETYNIYLGYQIEEK